MIVKPRNPERKKSTRGPRREAPVLSSRVPRAPSVETAPANAPGTIRTDPYSAIRFPNAIRERRRAAGIPSLLELARRLPAIPYIRLSKIERGEVVAKAGELRAIAARLGLDDAEKLLVDVEAPDFSLAPWAELSGERRPPDRENEELAMLLAAAFRARRSADPSLTLARLQKEHGLAAVIVSRLENAAKPFNRWNAATLAAAAAILGAEGRSALPAFLRAAHAQGRLDAWLPRVPGAPEREEKTRVRIAALRRELRAHPAPKPPVDRPAASRAKATGGRSPAPARLTVLGVPIGDGLIEPYPNPQQILPPPGTGPNGYALRMGRATVGAAIPAGAVLIVDPDRTPMQGGLAVLREERGLRVLIVTTDRDGRLMGHSLNPEKDIALDALAPDRLARVTAILFDQP